MQTKALRFIMWADLFAKPITLTYEKKTKFKTWQGGLITFFLFTILGGFLVAETIRLFSSPEYVKSSKSNFLKLSENDEPIILNPESLILAGKLDATFINTEEIARISFYELKDG